MFRKILIATDGSKHARTAVEFGADIAAKYGAEVVLAHVLLSGEAAEDLKHMAEIEHLTDVRGHPVLPRVAAGAEPGAATYGFRNAEDEARSYRILEAVGKKILENAESSVRAQGVQSVSKHLLDGKPTDQILKLIDKEKPDLLVCGARGLSDFQALLLGSVSHKLSQLAPVTCVTVR